MQWGAGPALQAWPLCTRGVSEQQSVVLGANPRARSHPRQARGGGSNVGASRRSHPSARQQQDRWLLRVSASARREGKSKTSRWLCRQGPVPASWLGWGCRSSQPLALQRETGKKSALSSIIQGRHGIAQALPGTPRGNTEPRGMQPFICHRWVKTSPGKSTSLVTFAAAWSLGPDLMPHRVGRWATATANSLREAPVFSTPFSSPRQRGVQPAAGGLLPTHCLQDHKGRSVPDTSNSQIPWAAPMPQKAAKKLPCRCKDIHRAQPHAGDSSFAHVQAPREARAHRQASQHAQMQGLDTQAPARWADGQHHARCSAFARALMGPSELRDCETQSADSPGLRKGLPAHSSRPKPNLSAFKPATNPVS